MKPAGNAKATEGVTLSGVPKGTGLSADSTLENSIKLDAEGAMLYANLSGKRTKLVNFLSRGFAGFGCLHYD